MAPHDVRRDPRHAVALLVRVAARDEEELAEKYATNISRGGVFLRTREPKPIGSYLRLEMRLADGTTAIRALGVVRFVQSEDPHARPPVSPGMGVQFVEIDGASRALVDRVCDLAAHAAELPKVVVEPSPEIPPPPREPPRSAFAFPEDDLARAIAEAAGADDAASQPLSAESFAPPDEEPGTPPDRRQPPPLPPDAVPARRPAPAPTPVAVAPPAEPPAPAPVVLAPAAPPEPAPAPRAPPPPRGRRPRRPRRPGSSPPRRLRSRPAPRPPLLPRPRSSGRWRARRAAST